MPFGLRGVHHQIVQPHLPLPAQHVQLLLLKRAAFVDRRVYLVDGDGRVHRSDVHHGGVPLAVKVRQARQWLTRRRA